MFQKISLATPTLILLLLMNTSAGISQVIKVTNTTDFMMDCLKTKGELGNRKMIVWYPDDFWKVTGSEMNAPQNYIESIVRIMKPYQVFTVVDYTLENGVYNYKTEAQIRKTLKLIDSSAKVYLPLPRQLVSAEAIQLSEQIKPIVAKSFGQLGSGIQLFFFRKESNKLQFNIRELNRFSVSVGDTEVTWNLPFASVLPAKHCPVDKEEMKGNWNFCPVHGVKLEK